MFRSLAAQLFKSPRVSLDNFVFRLHYRVTVGLLITCAVVLLWKINYLSPIQCVSRDDIASGVLNEHCWYHGVYTAPSLMNKTVGVDIIAPGVGYSRDSSDRQYHNVHRWIVIAVLAQAVFFFLPRIIWRTMEGNQVKKLMWTMNDLRNTDSQNTVRKQLIAAQLRSKSIRSFIYVGGYLLSEALNLVNVVVQLGLVRRILKTSGSLELLVLSRSERQMKSINEALPVRVTCQLYRYGPSGDIQRHDCSCMMSINAFIETIFVCQDIWFSFLTVLSALVLLYRLASLAIPHLRALRLQAKTKLIGTDTVMAVTRKVGIGEWFKLYMLSKNLDPVHMKDIMELICDVPNGNSQPMTVYPQPVTAYSQPMTDYPQPVTDYSKQF